MAKKYWAIRDDGRSIPNSPWIILHGSQDIVCACILGEHAHALAAKLNSHAALVAALEVLIPLLEQEGWDARNTTYRGAYEQARTSQKAAKEQA